MVQTMSGQINRERVNDTAKLMMHRLIARMIGRDPTLVERARISLGRSAEHFGDHARPKPIQPGDGALKPEIG